MKAISISELKARLSEHVRRVRAGERIIVTDRGLPVAALVPTSEALADPGLDELVEAGLLNPGVGKLPRDFWKARRPSDPQGRTLSSLLEDRASGR